jgi:hypothetical protein
MHALIPLAVLETLRSQDVPQPDGLDEFHEEFTTKRLGMSHTVERQIDRFRALAVAGARVSREEVVALFRLAGRRADADLFFADAGRRAGAMAIQRPGRVRRVGLGILPETVRRRIARRSARRVLRRTFGIEMTGGDLTFTLGDGTPFTTEALPDGSACGFLGGAAAAVLRAYAGFEGAVVHVACRANGANSCRWEAAGLGKA